MNSSSQKSTNAKSRSGFIKTAVILTGLLVAGVVAGTVYLTGDRDGKNSETVLTFTAFRDQFISSINESGDVASSSNVEIRCKVRQRGGTTILEIVEEGAEVKKDDFLVQLDDSSFRDELVEQKIRVAQDRASVIEAKSDLNTAEQTLIEFENGQFQQELATYEAEVAFAEETLRRSQEYQKYSENLAKKGYVTKAQLEADQFAVIKAEKELQLATSKLEVFSKFTQGRMEAQLKAEIEKQEANLEASQFTLELSQQRQKYYETQVAACSITAPRDGQVVYANEIDGRGESGIVIEEGVSIREGQPIIRLPDPLNMQVTTKVNDSKINSVKAGQKALIRLDTEPETPIAGVVRSIAGFPLPRRWSQAPIEYEVYVDIVDQNSSIRPGLRAKVEIFVKDIPNSVQVPVSSLINRGDSHYVVVQQGQGSDATSELRPVKIGDHNESHVIIIEGIEPGEHVLVDPDQFRAEKPKEDVNSKDKTKYGNT